MNRKPKRNDRSHGKPPDRRPEGSRGSGGSPARGPEQDRRRRPPRGKSQASGGASGAPKDEKPRRQRVYENPRRDGQRREGERPRPDRDHRPAATDRRPESRHAEPQHTERRPTPLPEHEAMDNTELDVGAYADMDVLSEEAPELGIGSRMVPPSQVFDEDPLESSRPNDHAEPGDLAAQIRSLEARLDGLIRRSAELRALEPDVEERTPRTPSVEPIQVAPVAATLAQEPVAELSGNSYTARQWGRAGMRSRVEEIDDFGLDPDFERKIHPFAEFLYKNYFRIQVEGIHHVPSEGRGVIVANHSGTLPLDGLMLRTALREEHPSARDLRWLAEDFIFYLPFAGVFMNRVGAVRACQENAERLLAKESLVAVFPEGIQGIKKLFRDRYRLQRFGRGGYIRLCLRMQAPLIPCAVIGAEESNPLLYRIERLSELVGLPYIPITPTFPLLGPVGLLPAPSKWKIKFGEPIYLDSYGPEAADDHVLVGRLSERVRTSIQAMLDTGVRERRSIWFG